MDKKKSRLGPIERHRLLVAELIGQYIIALTVRSAMHDLSKMRNPEKKFFESKHPPYWSEAYQKNLQNQAITSHYSINDHHPQHYTGGINGMSLLSIIEMVCDWLAASTYNSRGNFEQALEINRERFEIGEQLWAIIINTLKELGHYPIDSGQQEMGG